MESKIVPPLSEHRARAIASAEPGLTLLEMERVERAVHHRPSAQGSGAMSALILVVDDEPDADLFDQQFRASVGFLTRGLLRKHSGVCVAEFNLPKVNNSVLLIMKTIDKNKSAATY